MGDVISFEDWQRRFGPPPIEDAWAIARAMASQKPSRLALFEWRKFSGLSIADVAEILHIDLSYMSRLERGLRFPQGDQIFRLAILYGTSPEALFSPPAGEQWSA